MSEYVDRDAVTQMISEWADGYSYIEVSTEWAEDEVRKIPAADVAPVRHGRWIDSEEDGHLSICGVCNYPVDRFYKTKYCPNCGAKMDGGDERNV